MTMPDGALLALMLDHGSFQNGPTGVLIAVIAYELVSGLLGRDPDPSARNRVTLLGALVATGAAITGWQQADALASDDALFLLHRLLGLVTTGAMIGLAVAARARAERTYRALLLLCVFCAAVLRFAPATDDARDTQPRVTSESSADATSATPGATSELSPDVAPALAPGASRADVARTRPSPPPLPPALDAPVVPDADALARLRAERVHVEVDDPATGLLFVAFASRPSAESALVRAWLEPLRDVIVELSLAGTQVDDGVLPFVASLPRLERLDLSRTAVTSAGLPALADAPSLRDLNLTGTSVDGGAVASLADVARLERVSVWDTGLAAADVARLRGLHPALVVHDGRDVLSQPLQTEGELVFGVDASLRPVNTRCPVSGDAVDPRFAVVFEGRVIGFCCAECPGRFWADPTGFPVGE